jgi:REP element-mobilizing transposase RayT
MATCSTPQFHRRSIRLAGYDYTNVGAYFITICGYQRQLLFGEILANEMLLSPLGKIIKTEWEQLPKRFANIQLGSYSVLPDHMHGIIYITEDAGNEHTNRKFGGMVPGSIPDIVRAFKSSVTNRYRYHTSIPTTPIWQRNYYERIIRDMHELEMITGYIDANVERFSEDPYW